MSEYDNMSIPAVFGIVCFSLAILPGTQYYYQFSMGIIGKVYTNSVLVLINSRMLLGFDETPSTIASELKFTTGPPNNEDSRINTYNGDVT